MPSGRRWHLVFAPWKRFYTSLISFGYRWMSFTRLLFSRSSGTPCRFILWQFLFFCSLPGSLRWTGGLNVSGVAISVRWEICWVFFRDFHFFVVSLARTAAPAPFAAAIVQPE